MIQIELRNGNTNASLSASFMLYDALGNKVYENKNISKSSLLLDIGNFQNGLIPVQNVYLHKIVS
jgi:hypothetical protein